MDKSEEWMKAIERAIANPDQEEEKRLLAMMEEDQAEELARFVLAVLEFFPFSSRIEKVLFSLVKCQDGDVRASALSMLAKESTDPKIKELVLQGLKDTDKKVILEVLRIIRLKREDWQDHSSQIVSLLQHPDDEVKVEAMAVFASMYKEDKVWQETHPFLQSFLQHPDCKMRIKVLSILSSLGNIASRMKEQIIQRLKDSDEEVILEALSIIEKREWREALPLIKPLLHHPNGKVQVKAFYVLNFFWKYRLIVCLKLFDSLLRSRMVSYPVSFMGKFGYKPVIMQALKVLDKIVRSDHSPTTDEKDRKRSVPLIQSFLQHQDEKVRESALSVLYAFYLCKQNEGERLPRLKQLLGLPDQFKEFLIQMLERPRKAIIIETLSVIYNKMRYFEMISESFPWAGIHLSRSNR